MLGSEQGHQVDVRFSKQAINGMVQPGIDGGGMGQQTDSTPADQASSLVEKYFQADPDRHGIDSSPCSARTQPEPRNHGTWNAERGEVLV